jgi:NAD(P)-dependent dehydrogenase (short-subunit alcohol dehydrogenase family)
MRLQGKRILITGTGGGLGKAAQALFAREGARIVGCDVQSCSADLSATELRDIGFDVRGDTVDLADPDAARRWIDDAVASLGGLDVLYNNAAGYGFAPFAEMDLALWRHVMGVELDIVFHTTQPAWKHLMKRGGSIISTSSLTALRGIAPTGQVAHATAKGGIISMTKALAAEGAPFGIRANAISPGQITTPASAASMNKERSDFVMNMQLIRRTGTVDDIAPFAVYLASDESSWVTGQNFSIDGGVTAGYR